LVNFWVIIESRLKLELIPTTILLRRQIILFGKERQNLKLDASSTTAILLLKIIIHILFQSPVSLSSAIIIQLTIIARRILELVD